LEIHAATGESLLSFKNEEKGGLGMPLPAGTVRVYLADSKGESSHRRKTASRHTPKDETLKNLRG